MPMVEELVVDLDDVGMGVDGVTGSASSSGIRTDFEVVIVVDDRVPLMSPLVRLLEVDAGGNV